MPKQPKRRKLPKRIEEEKRRVAKTEALFIAETYAYPAKAKKIMPGKLMKRWLNISKAKKPVHWKASEFARTALLIKRAAERGLIPARRAVTLRKALRSRAYETIQREANELAEKGIIDQKFLNALEEMVEAHAIRAKEATYMAKTYLWNALLNLKLAPLRKPIDWKLRVLKQLREIVEIEAELRGFSERTKNELLRKLQKRAAETVIAEVKKPRLKIDFTVFDLIERVAKDGLITDAQAEWFNAFFIKNCLKAIKSGEMSSVGIGSLEPRIRRLPQEKRKRLLALLNEVRTAF
jgi:SOS response regulatory protein OraA/RecX